MKAEFTPGPWKCIKDEMFDGRIVPADAYGNSRGDGPICQVFNAYGRKDNNAHLIAAAPEMYEALRNIENDDGRIPASIWNMRNAALAKARGEKEANDGRTNNATRCVKASSGIEEHDDINR